LNERYTLFAGKPKMATLYVPEDPLKSINEAHDPEWTATLKTMKPTQQEDQMRCPICGNESIPIKRHPGFYYCTNRGCNMTGFEGYKGTKSVTRTQHINEVNALRSQNKLK